MGYFVPGFSNCKPSPISKVGVFKEKVAVGELVVVQVVVMDLDMRDMVVLDLLEVEMVAAKLVVVLEAMVHLEDVVDKAVVLSQVVI